MAFGEMSKLADGRQFPLWAEVRIFAGPESLEPAARAGEPVMVDLRLEIVDGVPQAESLRCWRVPGGPPVTNRTMRGLNLDKVAGLGADAVMRRLWMASVNPADPSTHGAFLSTLTAPRPVIHRSVDDDLLREVGRLYLADKSGRPVAHVAEALPTGYRNAARYVKRARDRGFLPEREDN
jgi:hypothetical protein